MAVKMYKVGGCVRDAILKLPIHDIDYTVVCSSFDEMKQHILSLGGTIFLEKPEYLTIRAKIGKEAADFVLARKDGSYYDGRHPDSVMVGSLEDDLRRRDLTMNAIAQDSDGSLIDPFFGIQDIDNKLIRCVGSTKERFEEDSLRMLRAIRFAITKGFRLDYEIVSYLMAHPSDILKVSEERIREELHKCFSHSTLDTLNMLERFYGIRDSIFSKCNIWLKPTSSEV
jgi:tRNA nucleotidyltransferase (CCA-adding enzyme)